MARMDWGIWAKKLGKHIAVVGLAGLVAVYGNS